MHCDDGQDMFAPPTPEPGMVPDDPQVSGDDAQMRWLVPLAGFSTSGLVAAFIYGIVKLLR
jgi:hypothetical protein